MLNTRQPDLLVAMKWDHSAFKVTFNLTFNHGYVHLVCIEKYCLHLRF